MLIIKILIIRIPTTIQNESQISPPTTPHTSVATLNVCSEQEQAMRLLFGPKHDQRQIPLPGPVDAASIAIQCHFHGEI